MNRRTTLQVLAGRKERYALKNRLVAPPATTTFAGLEPYSGEWTRVQAAHLLRRTTFGPTKETQLEAVGLGLQATLDRLFEELPLPDPPINFYYDGDPNVPIGETWVGAPYQRNKNDLITSRHRSLQGWTIRLMLKETISLREKMTLFWINHFGISDGKGPFFLYDYTTTLRRQAWGNFRQIVKDITIHPAMLRFLNGNQNTKKAPNENYARELLELFTIGKGPQVGPGDYTNFTEEDILAISNVLTGWKDVGLHALTTDEPVGSVFDPDRHDTGTKQLSFRFDGATISDMGEEEYSYLIDLIFSKDEVARHICRKLYRWFVYYKITDEVEAAVIEPMAQQVIADDYQLENALRMLLSSEHFFGIQSVGPMIKHPIDYVVSLFKPLRIPFPKSPVEETKVAFAIYNEAKSMEMDYFNVPEVAGWKAWYQGPLYFRTWINTTSLQQRMGLASKVVDRGWRVDDEDYRIDYLSFLEKLEDPYDPNALLAETADILLPQPLTDGQITALKEVLIPGLPDFEWTVEYTEHLANPDDQDLRNAVVKKLEATFMALLSAAEFHLS